MLTQRKASALWATAQSSARGMIEIMPIAFSLVPFLPGGIDMEAARWILAATAMGTALAWGATGDETVEGVMGTDRFLAGGTITRTQPVGGDLIAAGGTIEMDAPVAGDALVAGGNVRVGGNVAQNLYAAGGRLTIDGNVGRNARVAGGKVQVGPGASISGNLTIAGGNIAVHGAVKGYVQAAGGEVVLDGPIDGDVVVNGGRIRLGPHAKIAGTLTYRSGEALVSDPAAVVNGRIDRLSSAASGGVAGTAVASRFGFNGGWVWSAGLLLLAALFAAAVPPASMRVSSELRTRPWMALLFGFIALVCIPAAVLILMVTVIGIPLAMVVLLAYVILIVLGYVACAVGFADAAVARYRPADAQRSSTRVLAAVVAMLALTLVARIPFLGTLVAFLAMLAGIGALLMSLGSRKGAPPAPATAATPA
jgi:cytoskeletal protein CcmA (bactofilin family)